VSQTEPLCRISDRGYYSGRRSRDLQQKLVLLRLQPDLERSCLTEVQKEPQLMPKLS
jgi:hypothetical protein